MSRTTWPVSVKGVVQFGDGIVLLRNERSEWELPGGRLEPDETPEECVRREIREELGIDVEVADTIDVWLNPVRPDRTVVVITYGCVATVDASPRVSDEHEELAIVPADRIDEIPMPTGYKTSIRRWLGWP